VRVSDKRIQTFIGDKRLVNVGTEDRRVGIRLECMACRPLGLATYRTTGEVKAVEIRPLTASEAEEMNKKSDE
jgi:hypothetical protein